MQDLLHQWVHNLQPGLCVEILQAMLCVVHSRMQAETHASMTRHLIQKDRLLLQLRVGFCVRLF